MHAPLPLTLSFRLIGVRPCLPCISLRSSAVLRLPGSGGPTALLGQLTMDRDPLHDSILDDAEADAEASDASSATPSVQTTRHRLQAQDLTDRRSPRRCSSLWRQPGGCHADDPPLAEVLPAHHQCGHECQYWQLSASADCSLGFGAVTLTRSPTLPEDEQEHRRVDATDVGGHLWEIWETAAERGNMEGLDSDPSNSDPDPVVDPGPDTTGATSGGPTGAPGPC